MKLTTWSIRLICKFLLQLSSSFPRAFSPPIFFPRRFRLPVDRFSAPEAIINFARRSKCQSRSEIRMGVRSTCRICRFYRRLYFIYFTPCISLRSSIPSPFLSSSSSRYDRFCGHHPCCHNKLHERFRVSIVIEDIERKY